MAPPSFNDLGKNARDIFSKGFHIGLCKLDLKTKTSQNIEFNTAAQTSHDTGVFFGNLESKYKWKEYGATIKEVWATDNNLAFDITVEDKLLQGLKVGLNSKFNVCNGKKSGALSTAYKNDFVHSTVDYDLFNNKVLAGIVFGDKGFLGGFRVGSDSLKSVKDILSCSNVALGYKKDDLEIHIGVKNCQEYAGSVYQKVYKDLETGVHLSWLSGSGETAFGFGAKYTVDDETAFKVKVDNSCRVGLSYQQKIRPGVTATLSTLLEGRSLSAGGHKFGLALEFEP